MQKKQIILTGLLNFVNRMIENIFLPHREAAVMSEKYSDSHGIVAGVEGENIYRAGNV